MLHVFRSLPPGPAIIVGSDIPGLAPAHVARGLRGARPRRHGAGAGDRRRLLADRAGPPRPRDRSLPGRALVEPVGARRHHARAAGGLPPRPGRLPRRRGRRRGLPPLARPGGRTRRYARTGVANSPSCASGRASLPATRAQDRGNSLAPARASNSSLPRAQASDSLLPRAQASATHSISMSNSIGHDAMATKVRAGGSCGK